MNIAMVLGIAMALVLVLPLSWKWQLGMKRVALFLIVNGIVFSLVLTLLGLTTPAWLLTTLVAASTVVLSAAYLAYRFYRDPERSPTSEPGAIVSPADGVVIYVKRSQQGQVPVATKGGRRFPVFELLKTSFYSCDVWIIGISMSLLDVHVNRAPVAGTVTFQKHFPGKFGSLRLAECEFDNERATTIFESGLLQIAVVQIASRLVRQIVSYIKVGDAVALGQRMGAIRLGSQVDLILPVCRAISITVQVGTQVKAGETILASYNAVLASDNQVSKVDASLTFP